MNGDITLAALCHCQRASKVIAKICVTTVVRVTVNNYSFTRPFVSNHF